jgi:hypothetical protein
MIPRANVLPETDRPEPSASQVARSTNQALREAADRLVGEWRHVPPGSVLRTFSSSVRTALLEGHAFPELTAVAELRTRQALALRSLDDRRSRRTAARPRNERVPRPRLPA